LNASRNSASFLHVFKGQRDDGEPVLELLTDFLLLGYGKTVKEIGILFLVDVEEVLQHGEGQGLPEPAGAEKQRDTVQRRFRFPDRSIRLFIAHDKIDEIGDQSGLVDIAVFTVDERLEVLDADPDAFAYTSSLSSSV